MKLNYKIFGEGKPLIILHGLFGSLDNWQTHAKKLAEFNKVYLVDQRNHGSSPHSNEHTYELMCEDLLNLFAEENIREAILLGHSMGGKTAMLFAQNYGHLLDQLIVVDMGMKAYPPHHDVIFQGLFNVRVEDCESRKEADLRLGEYVTDESTKQFLLKSLYWKEPKKLAWRFNLVALHVHIEDILSALPNDEIEVQSLFIRGGKSNYVTEQDITALHKLISNLKVTTMEDAGHWVHAENPEEFLKIVSNFIRP